LLHERCHFRIVGVEIGNGEQRQREDFKKKKQSNHAQEQFERKFAKPNEPFGAAGAPKRTLTKIP
jgi:hypothetical protein